ncbi:replication protein [Nocardia farcinica]|uniref:replication protein n=1 Tax=Nocardia farcinica TaxID=37329 RepID=UPI0024540AB8|nr:replication protein [Nocardia farcinica]
MKNHWSEDIARPEQETTESRRVLPITASSAATIPLSRPPAAEIDKWRATIETAIGGGYRGTSPTRRRRGRAKCPSTVIRGHVCGHQCTAISPRLIAMWGGQKAVCRRLCQVRLDPRDNDNDGPVRGVACWFSRESWLDSVGSTFDRRYRSIRPILVRKRAGANNTGGGITKKAFMAVATAMAAAADWKTGRNCRLSNIQIAQRAGVSKTTVTRVRLAMLLMGVATEVLRGRQRTLAERMASWRVGDKARGWASVWALHPTRAVPGDNPVDNRQRICPGQPKMATHPGRGLFLSEKETLGGGYLTPGRGERGASRRKDAREADGKAAPPPQKALILALRWLGDARSPDWARRNRPDAWAKVLVPAAEHGWTPDDLNESLRPSAEVRHPLAYVRAMLDKVDLPFPPHVLREIEERRAAQQRAAVDAAVNEAVAAAKQAEQIRRAEVKQAALNGEGRRTALQQAQAIGESSAHRRESGERFDHRAHWRRLRGRRSTPPS